MKLQSTLLKKLTKYSKQTKSKNIIFFVNGTNNL